jgi:hypothetical protein
MLTGHLEELPAPLTQLSTTGLLRDEPPRTIERWIDAACAAGLVRVSDDRYQTLSLTPLGRDLMMDRLDEIRMTPPVVRTRPRARAGGRARRRRRRRAP